MDSQHATPYDLSHSLTPLSPAADSNDEVDRLLTFPVTPEWSLPDDRADEESDLSPLTSSDEEGKDVNTTPRPLKDRRMLRPRVAKVIPSMIEYTTSSLEATGLPSPPSAVDQPQRISKKRKHTESLPAEITPTARAPKPKPGPYVSKETCHQCRNLPRYAFMRCTTNDESGRLCRKLFCASCVIKRYPDDVDLNPQIRKWKCPFCRDVCNCTKCCFKRSEAYTSTSDVKIDHETLLYYAALMPGNSKPKKSLPPPKPPKLANHTPKPAKKSDSKLVRSATRTKLEKARNADMGAARDVASIIRGLADTAAMFEGFGCVSGEYWGVVFSNVDGGRIGVAYVGEQLPDIFVHKDVKTEEDDEEVEVLPPRAKRPRVSSRLSA